MILAGRSKLRVSKNFFGGHLFVFVEYLCKRSPKIKTKNIKNYSSILAIVNHRNWLDDSPPLSRQSNRNETALQTWPQKFTPMISKKFEKSGTHAAKNRQKIKPASRISRFIGSKKEECTLTCSLLKNFET